MKICSCAAPHRAHDVRYPPVSLGNTRTMREGNDGIPLHRAKGRVVTISQQCYSSRRRSVSAAEVGLLSVYHITRLLDRTIQVQ